MDRNEIFERVKKIVALHVEPQVTEDELTEDTRWEDLDVDSLDLVEVTFDLEKEFRVAPTTKEWLEVKTLGNFADIVLKHIKK